MASTHRLFREFDNAIKLTTSKRDELTTSRDAIRSDIRQWLKDKDKGQARFKLQGSFAMHTVINPIDDDEFDIDDGLYLEEFEDANKEDWPACSTVHSWVVSAVQGRTKTPPKDKNACVRVTYGHGYHVDIPIYIKLDGAAYFADKARGWTQSDAEGFVEWLDGKNDAEGQLKRIIRYIKRWKDYCNVPLKGIELTILCAQNFSPANGRDDDAVRYTMENVLTSLKACFECKKPVAAWEDLFEGKSDADKSSILAKLEKLLDALISASSTPSEGDAADFLRGVFESDFPKPDHPKNTLAYVTTSAPAVLKHDGRSG